MWDIFGWKKKQQKSTKKSLGYKLRVEALEDRWIPSVNLYNFHATKLLATTASVSSLGATNIGQTNTLTATVIGSVKPTGSVAFKDGDLVLGYSVLDNTGHARLNWTFTAGGTHKITAIYGGDSKDAGSTSAAYNQLINYLKSTTTLATSQATNTINQSITYTAVVKGSNGSNGSGSVVFTDNGSTLSTVTLDSTGTARVSVVYSMGGSHNVVAYFAGNKSLLTSQASLTETILSQSTSISILPTQTSVGTNQADTFTIRVSAGGNFVATGVVTIKDGDLAIGTATLNTSGVATFTYSFTTAGSHSLTASYAGDSHNQSAISSQIKVSVTNPPLATTTTLNLPQGTVTQGQSVVLGVTVSAANGTPIGSVTYFDGTTAIGTATLDATGKASLNYTFTSTGTHALSVVFAGSVGFLTSTSSSLSLNVAASGNQDIAGSSIVGQLRSSATGLVLVINGTNSDDKILVSQNGSSFILTTSAGSQTFTAPAGQTIVGLVINSYNGNDTVRIDASVTASITSTINAGNGNDLLIDNGADACTINAGAGTDTAVTIGGGADKIVGGSGFTSFWYDANDLISNTTTTEIAALGLHKITGFTSPVSGSSVSLEIAGQQMIQPTTTYAYKSFASSPLFAGTPQFNDIEQGYLGDCYYLAALSSMAQTNPQSIVQSITALGDGTFAVRFFKADGTASYYRIDAQLPVSGNSPVFANLTRNGNALWVPLLEKAFAEFRTTSNSYASIEAGWMAEGYRAITGHSDTWFTTSGTTADQIGTSIQTALNNGLAVTAATYSSPPKMVGGHAYEVHGITKDAVKGWLVTVYNPWGVDGVTWDSNSNDGLLTLAMTDFISNYGYVDIIN